MNEEVVIITGSTRGIGKSIACTLARRGAKVVINGTSEENVKAVVQEIRAAGGEAAGCCGRVEELETGEKLIQTAIEAFGRATILINNAGNNRDRMAHRLSEDDWDSVISTHLKGTFSAVKPFILHRKKDGGEGIILNMTSRAGIKGTMGQLNYSAAKAGIIGMTKTLAQELKREHILVLALSPAALTDMTSPHVEKAKAKALEEGRELESYWEIGTAEDVAAFVGSLIEKKGSIRSGAVYSVNGKQAGVWEDPVWHELNLS
ncbi:SDR family oxidoreductase [Bacillus sp. KH172YL63]|uniref:SDR family oxidoreductase n=1 Tax=Bacillus sp. KH172YL63 TaxID=2709784 RepID=UPI0013E51FB2|nr:SDR family NAD(P)-dependent oxidoreductase [Bacillus sp. KH172YL63]BCB02897.1 dehydrogenase [Bacillus sp. KH172YL63]